MTTVAQVRQAVQPLLQRNPDLALVGRLVVLTPVHHILRGVYIDRSLDPGLFVPSWAIIFLFEPRQSFSLNWGEQVYRQAEPGVWDIADADTSITMCEAIEKQALALLRPVKTIDDFVRFTAKERFRDTYLALYELRKVFVDAALGDFDAARSICSFLATKQATCKHLPRMQEEYDRVTKELCPLITANDRRGLARLLHAYEGQSVKNLKLEQFWEPTPFPIEQAG
jgi:hypothetical protein